MTQDTFSEFVAECIAALPRDMKTVLRVVDEPDIGDEDRAKTAGLLLYILSGANALPGLKGVMAYVDDAFLLRLVMQQVRSAAPEALESHIEAAPELFDDLDGHIDIIRAELGAGLFALLEKSASTLSGVTYRGHTAKGCAASEDESTWLYDAVHEELTEKLDLDEDEVVRESKTIRDIIERMQLRTPGA